MKKELEPLEFEIKRLKECKKAITNKIKEESKEKKKLIKAEREEAEPEREEAKKTLAEKAPAKKTPAIDPRPLPEATEENGATTADKK